MKPVIICFAVLAGAGVARADVPPLVPVQGVLADANGTPLDGTVNVRFRIYDAATDGTTLYDDTLAVDVDMGEFTVYLGDGVALAPALFHDRATYLGLTIGTDAEMTPRLELGTVPYAAYAGHAASAETAASATNATTLAGVPLADLQRRVGGACSANTSIREIAADGTVTCEPDSDTTYTFSAGLTASGNTVSADASYLQRRVTGQCPVGASMRVIQPDGTVACDTDRNTTYNTTCGPGYFVSALSQNGTVTCAQVVAAEKLVAESSSEAAVSDTSAVRTFCALTLVRILPGSTDTGTNRYCALSRAVNGTWTLYARAATGSQVGCEAYCL